jgi:murein DD-endopeptidase MepM/ murein hydrolase activator NlpD
VEVFGVHVWSFLWKRLPLLAVLVVFLPGAVACASRDTVGSLPVEPLPATELPLQTATAEVKSSLPEKTRISPDSVAVVDQQPEVTPTPVFSSTHALKNQSAFGICSPLSIHPLEELPEIISDPYHPPPLGKEERHQGVDFSYYRRGERLSIRGVGVQSVLSGSVAMALVDTFPYGNVVIIETLRNALPPDLVQDLQIAQNESLYVLYAHMENSPEVKLDQNVNACQPLGEVGMSGNAGVPHLHIETRIGPTGTRFSGMRFYDTQATQLERDNYLLWRTSGIYRHFNPMDLLLSRISDQ